MLEFKICRGKTENMCSMKGESGIDYEGQRKPGFDWQDTNEEA